MVNSTKTCHKHLCIDNVTLHFHLYPQDLFFTPCFHFLGIVGAPADPEPEVPDCGCDCEDCRKKD